MISILGNGEGQLACHFYQLLQICKVAWANSLAFSYCVRQQLSFFQTYKEIMDHWKEACDMFYSCRPGLDLFAGKF